MSLYYLRQIFFSNLLLNSNETPLVLFELKGNRVFIDYDVMFGCVSIVELMNLHLHEYLLCLCMSTLHLFGSLGYESFLVMILFFCLAPPSGGPCSS